MKKSLLLAGVLLALTTPKVAIGQAEYLDLTRDQVIPGGIQLAVRSGAHSYFDSRIVIFFPFELKLKMWFQQGGKGYQRTGKIHANVPLIAAILKKERTSRGTWKFWCQARLAVDCGNPFEPFRFTTEVPSITTPGQEIRFRETEILEPEKVVVDRMVYIDRPVGEPRQVVVNLLPAEPRPPAFRLEVTGNLQAEKSWRQTPDFWDRLTGFLHSVSFPVGMLLRKPDRLVVNSGNRFENRFTNNNSNSQKQGQDQHQMQVAEAAAAAAAAASSSSTSAVPGAATGSSGSSSGSAGSGR